MTGPMGGVVTTDGAHEAKMHLAMAISMTVGDALRAAAQRLRARGSRSPRLDAELLLAEALSADRGALFRAPERTLTLPQAERFECYVRRREAREPVAYIRGRRAFRTIEVEVTHAVLIPVRRPRRWLTWRWRRSPPPAPPRSRLWCST